MTTKAIQLRRGSTGSHGVFTGLQGELTIDTDKNTAIVHDGQTVGGIPLAREDLENVSLEKFKEVGLADSQLSNVSDEAIVQKFIARADLSNVDTSVFTSRNLLMRDLSNISLTSAAATSLKAGIVKLASADETLSGQDNTKAITPYAFRNAMENLLMLPPRYISGLLISVVSDTEIMISTGYARDTENKYDINLPRIIIKSIDETFYPGIQSGGRAPNLPLLNNQLYYVFILYNPDTMEVSAGYDTDQNGINLTSSSFGFTQSRRIGLVKTDASSKLIPMSYSEETGGRVNISFPTRAVCLNHSGAARTYVVNLGYGNLVKPVFYADQNNSFIELKNEETDAYLGISKFPNGVFGVIIKDFPTEPEGGYDVKVSPSASTSGTCTLTLASLVDERIK
ncbi:MAG: hypothetical protein LBR35_01960 [Rickettsiales bacterium]|jgi:hypothetical protein|nr:hypothetical protein [Rickettsiales bacterium]